MRQATGPWRILRGLPQLFGAWYGIALAKPQLQRQVETHPQVHNLFQIDKLIKVGSRTGFTCERVGTENLATSLTSTIARRNLGFATWEPALAPADETVPQSISTSQPETLRSGTTHNPISSHLTRTQCPSTRKDRSRPRATASRRLRRRQRATTNKPIKAARKTQMQREIPTGRLALPVFLVYHADR